MTGVVIASAGLGICLIVSMAGCIEVAHPNRRAGWVLCTAVAAGVLGFLIGLAWAGRP